MTAAPHHGEPDFEDLSHRVYRLCLALLRHGDDAQDAMQEAMLRAWSRRTARREDVPWWTWCGGFAVRVCREFQRKRRRDPASLEDGVPQAVAGMLQADGQDLGAEDFSKLHEAVAALPQRQREVTVLRFLMALSTQETAAVLDCPEGTVKSNLHKAIASLHAALHHGLISDELRRV